MANSKQKNKNVRIYVLSMTFAVFFSFSPIKAATSHAWMAIPAAQYEVMLTEIFDQIKGVLVNTLKQQAAKTLSQEINNLVGGNSSGESMIITDWEDYLISKPEKTAQLYLNDYLSQLTSGRGSSINYIPSSSSIEGFGGGSSYLSSLKENTLKNITENNSLKTDYEGSPSQMFASGNFKNFDSFLSGINNPWTFQINAKNEYQKKLENEKIKKQVQGTANGGLKSTGEGDGLTKDRITMPGSIIKDMYVNVEDIPNKILASATRPAEVVSSLCSSIINKAVSKGIGQVNKYVNQATSGVQEKINSAVGSDVSKYYNYLNTSR